MKLKPYVMLLLVLSLLVSLSILFVPGLGESIEVWMLGFLSRNAAV
ncbi:MAG: hypothetical protein WDZ52_14805 [Pseudohongiellaceae bacterium]